MFHYIPVLPTILLKPKFTIPVLPTILLKPNFTIPVLPTILLKPDGYIYFTNETDATSPRLDFSFYLKLNEEVDTKRQIILIQSKSRQEQVKIFLHV